MKICLDTGLAWKGKIWVESERIDYVVGAQKKVDSKVGGYDTGAKYEQYTYMVKLIMGSSLLIVYVDSEEKMEELVDLLLHPSHVNLENKFSISGYSEYSEKKPATLG